jgi:hypothetical protein
MLWDHYVFRRGSDVPTLWEQIHSNRPLRLLYIAGRGFDVRAQRAMREYVSTLQSSCQEIEQAKLLLVGFSGYELDNELSEITEENACELASIFSPIGSVETLIIGQGLAGEEDGDIGATNALRLGVQKVLSAVDGLSDIVLDVSSLPRVAYLALLTSILDKLVPSRERGTGVDPLYASGVNFQIVVAEDAALDARIRAEDPSGDLIQIPGFAGAFHSETVKDWPLVWFPILGENRVNQLEKVLSSSEIPREAEICPVVPHPSRNPRRADDLLTEYLVPLFKSRRTPTSNIIYVHEANPFEAYRQLLGAMKRYQHSMKLLGNCRLVVTPLGSKLVTLGAGLACFEMRPSDAAAKYRVAVPLAEPRRYIAQPSELKASTPDLSVLLLTGSAFGI